MRQYFKGMGLVAAAAMLATTTAANAQQAPAPTAPASEKVDDGNALHSGVGTTTLVEIGILAALTAIVLVATRNSGKNSNGTPTSP